MKVSASYAVNEGAMARVKARLRAQGERVRAHAVHVGIPDSEGGKAIKNYDKVEGNVTLAYVALAHEYGAGVPERSWFRSWFDVNVERMRVEMREAMQAERAGNDSAVKALAQSWALELRSWIVDDQAKLEPLRESTVRRRQQAGIDGATPLFAVGQIVDAIKATLDGEVLA